MRILQIVPSIALVYGGPSQMVRGLSAALAKQGVDLTILTTDSNGDTGQAPLDVPLNQPVAEEGYTVRYFRCSPFRRYKFSVELLNWLWQHASEFDLAHIHALFSPVTSCAATVARTRKLPYILRPLGTLDPADLRKKKQLKQLYATVLERPNIAGAAALHFTSQQEAQTSERFGVSTRDIIMPLGVNPIEPLAEVTPNEDTPVILFMSRIEPKKGLNLLIPALEQVLAAGYQFEFVLAGSNPQDPNYEAQIQNKIQQSPLAAGTKITGFVTGSQKTALLQQADLFVLPSYYENFGIAVAEAMVAGVPVIISDGVHIWEDVKQAEAGWVGSCEVEGIAALVKSALGDCEERHRRGSNAKAYARKHYSWDAIAQQMIQVYDQMIHQTRV